MCYIKNIKKFEVTTTIILWYNNDMNLNTINYYIATVEEMNITHAAQRLFISQQALSNHIARLEEELGVKLFNRSPVLSLTYAGKRFYDYALQMANIERQIHQDRKSVV